MIRTRKLNQLIDSVSLKEDSENNEYLGYFSLKIKTGQTTLTHCYFKPSKFVIEYFKQIIGNKWANKPFKTKIEHDLLKTNIVISGKYLVARGGLCPSGARLFEISDVDELDFFIEHFLKTGAVYEKR